MNSCLYECKVMHHRLEPKRHRFVYSIFMFCLDLDEIDEVAGKLRLVSRNKPNVFAFHDSDHLRLDTGDVRAGIHSYLSQQGIAEPARIMLLTNLRTFGYVFNPVSFYYCFDKGNRPLCAIAEIGNTFGEMKPFLLGEDTLRGDTFESRATKHFYVSPFISLTAIFDFHLGIPSGKLLVRINDLEDGRQILLSSLSGERRELTDWNLLKYTVRFPAVTVKVISAIHWQALLLWLKKIPHYAKASQVHLEEGVYRARHHS